MSETAHELWSRTGATVSTATVRDYIDLLKPRVMSLVVFTAWIGMVIAPVHIHPFAAALAVLAVALGSGAAGAIGSAARCFLLVDGIAPGIAECAKLRVNVLGVASGHAGIADFHATILAWGFDTCKPLETLGQGGGVTTDRL